MYSTGPLELESLSSPQPEFEMPDVDGHISTFTNTLLLHRLLVTGQVQDHPEKNTFLFQDLDRYNHFRPFFKTTDRSGLFQIIMTILVSTLRIEIVCGWKKSVNLKGE